MANVVLARDFFAVWSDITAHDSFHVSSEMSLANTPSQCYVVHGARFHSKALADRVDRALKMTGDGILKLMTTTPSGRHIVGIAKDLMSRTHGHVLLIGLRRSLSGGRGIFRVSRSVCVCDIHR